MGVWEFPINKFPYKTLQHMFVKHIVIAKGVLRAIIRVEKSLSVLFNQALPSISLHHLNLYRLKQRQKNSLE